MALVLPEVGTTAMQLMLDELGKAVKPGAHALVIMDRAGWHVAKQLDTFCHRAVGAKVLLNSDGVLASVRDPWRR